VLIDIATFVGLAILYVAYDVYVSRGGSARLRGHTGHEHRAHGTVLPFNARRVPRSRPRSGRNIRHVAVIDTPGSSLKLADVQSIGPRFHGRRL